MGKIVTKNEILNRLNGIKEFSEEYDIYNDSIIGVTKKAIFKHKICNYSFNMIIKDFLYGQRCPLCAKEKRIKSCTKNLKIIKNINYKILNKNDIDNIFLRINKINNSRFEFLSFENDKNIKPSKRKIELKDIKCGKVFKKNYYEMLYNHQSCPFCKQTGKKNDITYVNKKLNEHGFLLLSSYVDSHSKLKLKCLNCGEEQEHSFNTIVNLGGRCSCQKTIFKGEFTIKNFLMENKIAFIKEKIFEDLKYLSALKYDFYLPDKNIIIEYDGKQHFIENTFFNHDSLEVINTRDIIKNQYCLNNDITIIRISYKESFKKIPIILKKLILDGKPYDGKLSRTVWVGGKSEYKDYCEYNKI